MLTPLAIILLVVIFIVSYLYWQINRVKSYYRSIGQDSKVLNILIGKFYQNGLFEKPADKVCATGKLWTGNYPIDISTDVESTIKSYEKAERQFLILLLIIIAGSQFLIGGLVFLILIAIVVLLSTFIKLSSSAVQRVYEDLASLSWLIYHFHKDHPDECSKFIQEATSLKKLYEGITLYQSKGLKEHDPLLSLLLRHDELNNVYKKLHLTIFRFSFMKKNLDYSSLMDQTHNLFESIYKLQKEFEVVYPKQHKLYQPMIGVLDAEINATNDLFEYLNEKIIKTNLGGKYAEAKLNFYFNKYYADYKNYVSEAKKLEKIQDSLKRAHDSLVKLMENRDSEKPHI